MSRAEESPEASIEEILASIRKTFADDPQSQATASVSPNSTPAPATSRSSFFPSFRSASDAPATSPSIPLPVPSATLAAAIDADLADLIDSPASKSADSSPVEAAREKWANLLNPGQSVAAPSAKPAEAIVMKAETPATPQTSAQSLTGLFAPRKGGFYPPQEPVRSEPVLPMPSTGRASEMASPPPATSQLAEPAPGRSGFIAAAASAVAPVDPAPPVPAEPVPTPNDVPAASARALDDLVAGLNNVATAPAEPAAAPAPVAAVLEPPASRIVSAFPASAPAAPVAPAEPAESSAASASRTLEDAVADMLRPMLEKWIDENMPRIVERALQRDASLTGKKGS